MSRIGPLRFRLADHRDDADLRGLLRDQSLPGWISLSFQREPDFFHAAGTEGDRHQALLAHDARSGALLAMHTRSVRAVYVDGTVQRLGYLGGLRTDPRLPAGRWRLRLMREGFEAGRRLLREPGELPYDLTAILDDNAPARRLLEASLPGLPAYTPLTPWLTLAFGCRAWRVGRTSAAQYRIRGAARGDEGTVVSLLRDHHRDRQLAPVWDAQALASPRRCRGLGLEDFLVVERDGMPVGCLALWDQRAFKQLVVRGYRSPLGRLRGVSNLLAPLLGWPRLPAPGQALAQGWLSHFALAPEHAAALPALLHAALARGRQRGLDQLLLGLSDPHFALAPLRRAFRPARYRSMLYLVHWPEDAVRLPDTRRRPVHVETATL